MFLFLLQKNSNNNKFKKLQNHFVNKPLMCQSDLQNWGLYTVTQVVAAKIQY